jgi:hypothetical protein
MLWELVSAQAWWQWVLDAVLVLPVALLVADCVRLVRERRGA